MSDEESEKFLRETWCTRIMNNIFCRSNTAEEPLEAQPVPVCQLLRYATSSDKLLLSIGMLLAMFIGAIHPFPVIVEGVIANIYLKDKNHENNKSLLDKSLFWCGVTLIGGIVTVICAFIQSYLLSRVCTNIVRTIRKEFVKAVLHQEAEWFDGMQAGAITAKLNDNVERIRDDLSDKMAFIFRGCSMFTSATIFAFIVNWRVTVASIAIGPVGAIAMSLLTKFSAKPIREQMKAVSEATAVAEEAIMNVKTVAACNGQNHMIKKYESILDKSKKIGIRTHIINGIMDGFLLFQVYSFSTAGLIYFANISSCVPCGKVRKSIVCLAEKSVKSVKTLFKKTKRSDLFKKSRKPSDFEDERKNGIKLQFTNIRVSFLEVKLFEMNITKKLLDQIGQQYDLGCIESVVIDNCSFHLSSEEFCDFLRKLKLKTLELTEVTTEPEFITNVLIELPTQKVLISSKDFIQCLNVTIDLLKNRNESPENILRNLELRKIKTGIKLADILSKIKSVKDKITNDIVWAIGFDYSSPEVDKVLLEMFRMRCESCTSDDDDMRKYERNRSLRLVCWIKQDESYNVHL